MKISIIGAGSIGSVLAKQLVEAGYEVAVSNSRGPESLLNLVSALGPRAVARSVAEAARFGDVVVLMTPFRNPEALPDAELLRDKIVIDAMNPYREDGSVETFHPSSSSEQTKKRLPAARLVKAFNTIWSEHLKSNGKKELPHSERHAIPVASDDDDAKQAVMQLINDIGFAAVDAGSLSNGIHQEPGTAIYNNPMKPAEMMRIIGIR